MYVNAVEFVLQTVLFATTHTGTVPSIFPGDVVQRTALGDKKSARIRPGSNEVSLFHRHVYKVWLLKPLPRRATCVPPETWPYEGVA